MEFIPWNTLIISFTVILALFILRQPLSRLLEQVKSLKVRSGEKQLQVETRGEWQGEWREWGQTLNCELHSNNAIG